MLQIHLALDAEHFSRIDPFHVLGRGSLTATSPQILVQVVEELLYVVRDAMP